MATLFVRFDVIGLHSWPSATGRRAYLANQHRHKFLFEVRLDAQHDDREVEFHDLIDRARGLLPAGDGVIYFGSHSCESIARDLANALCKHYGRPVEVSVAEDGEVGAIVRSEP